MTPRTRKITTTLALALTTALFATGCIGVAPGDLPFAGQETTFIFHPGFKHKAASLLDPSNVARYYEPGPNMGQLSSVVISFDVRNCQPGTSGRTCPVVQGRETRTVTKELNWHRQSNGAYTASFVFPPGTCWRNVSGSASYLQPGVTVEARWTSGVERINMMVKSGAPCDFRR